MRIIAGKYKRSNLNTLDGLDTRPTRDMVKEALFSSIDIENKRVLDLFSGSGAIGIEALSRGALDVVFNDANKNAVKIIRENLAKFKEERNVLNLDWKECLNRLNEDFDFIYLDPPYAFEHYEEMIGMIIARNLLKEDGIIVAEVRKDVDLKEINGIVYFKEKKYGINKLYYMKRGNKE